MAESRENFLPQPAPDEEFEVSTGRGVWTPHTPRVRKFMWTSRLDYLLTLVGYCVGLGNLWRFPYVCQRNGGGAFLIPYLLFMSVVTIPLVFLEVIIGQFSRLGPIGAWGLCPFAKGLGITQVILSGLAVPYYSVVFSWALYYLYKSFSPVLPWTTCENTWNTPDCVVRKTPATNISKSFLTTGFTLVSDGTNTSVVSAAEQFWKNDVLGLSSGLEDFGWMQLHLVVVWLITCLVIFLCVLKGMRSVGKVVYVTALLPYFLLAVLLVRSCMMPGAVDGILFYIVPDLSRLAHYQIWLEALIQVFFSVGPGWGAIITIASYNPASNNAAWDAIIVTVVGAMTSIFAGFVVFATLGFVAHELGTSVENVVSSGPGLGFIVYPEAVSILPVPQLWSVLFFLMLLMLGIDSTFGFLETVVTTMEDIFSRYLPTTTHLHAMMAALYMAVVFCIGLPFTTNAGMYIYQLVDSYIAIVAPLLIAALECFVISWIYGIRRFSVDVEYMLGRQPPVILKMFCCIITPTLLIIALAVMLIEYKPPSYGHYTYSHCAEIIGWCLATIPLLPIPVTMVVQVIRTKVYLRQRLNQVFKPDISWENSTQRYRAEEYEMWLGEKTSVLDNARFIFIREKPL